MTAHQEFKSHKLKKPCKNCPFRKQENGFMPVKLNKPRAEEIAAHVFSNAKDFYCHKTTVSGEYDEDIGYQASGAESACAGAAIMQINNGMPSQFMQVARRMGWADELGFNDLDLESGVFETPQDFIDFHAG